MLNTQDDTRTFTWPQPWASLIVEGLKTLEATNLPACPDLIGQRMRIKAAAHPFAGAIDVQAKKLMDRALRERGWTLARLPRGVVVGDVQLLGCYNAVSGIVNGKIALGEGIEGSPRRVRSIHVGRREQKFGDFQPGRWIWQFRDACPLKNWDTGTIKFFDNVKGYGFIRWGETDVLVNHRVRNASGVAMIPGREVHFRAEETHRGFRALELAERII
jgi:cold shock CspA family protein